MWETNPYYLIVLAAVTSVLASLIAIILAELLLNGTISAWIKKVFKASVRGVAHLFGKSRAVESGFVDTQHVVANDSRQSIANFELAKLDIFQYLQSKLGLSGRKIKQHEDIAVGQDYVNYKSRVANYDELLVSYQTSLLLQKQLENITENLLCLISNKNYDGEIKFEYLPLEQTVRYAWYQVTRLNIRHRTLCDINIRRSQNIYSDQLKLELLLASIFCNILCLYSEPKSASVTINDRKSQSDLVIKVITREPPSLDSLQLFNMLYSDKSIANIFKRHEMCLAILKIMAELLNARIRATKTSAGLSIEVSGLLIV